jgi:hypothetical protein
LLGLLFKHDVGGDNVEDAAQSSSTAAHSSVPSSQSLLAKGAINCRSDIEAGTLAGCFGASFFLENRGGV